MSKKSPMPRLPETVWEVASALPGWMTRKQEVGAHGCVPELNFLFAGESHGRADMLLEAIGWVMK